MLYQNYWHNKSNTFFFIQGFSLYHIGSSFGDVKTNNEWPGGLWEIKTNTVLRYKDGFKEVELWGHPALYRKGNDKETRIVEKFKLYLGNCLPEHRPELPVDYRKAITDYLSEMGKVNK